MQRVMDNIKIYGMDNWKIKLEKENWKYNVQCLKYLKKSFAITGNIEFMIDERDLSLLKYSLYY